MNVIYDSDSYCVLEYPPERGYEVVDKYTRRFAFLQSGAAAGFLERMKIAANEDASVEHLDEVLEGMDALFTLPVRRH